MTPFTEYWISATIAPESIAIVKESSIGALLCIKDESDSQRIMLVESFSSNQIVGIGYTYEEVKEPVDYSFSEACQIIADKLGLLRRQNKLHS